MQEKISNKRLENVAKFIGYSIILIPIAVMISIAVIEEFSIKVTDSFRRVLILMWLIPACIYAILKARRRKQLIQMRSGLSRMNFDSHTRDWRKYLTVSYWKEAFRISLILIGLGMFLSGILAIFIGVVSSLENLELRKFLLIGIGLTAFGYLIMMNTDRLIKPKKK